MAQAAQLSVLSTGLPNAIRKPWQVGESEGLRIADLASFMGASVEVARLVVHPLVGKPCIAARLVALIHLFTAERQASPRPRQLPKRWPERVLLLPFRRHVGLGGALAFG